MKINTALQQNQKQLLAPAMQQSIELLLLPLADLNLSINQELEENPLLEVDEDQLRSLQDLQKDELLKVLELTNQSQNTHRSDHNTDDEIMEERPIEMGTSLENQLIEQLRIELSDPQEIKIGEFIIGSLNEDGYLTATCEEIAKATETRNLIYVDYVLKIIQNFEPIGIASRNLKECLLHQAHLRCNGNNALITEIIENHLGELARKKYQNIARKVKTSFDCVKEAAHQISQMEPKPARNYRPLKTNLYIKPDILVTQNEDGQYQIQINREGSLPLRVNSQYQKMLRQNNLSTEEKAFIREKLNNAINFVKSIEQRGHTIVKISEYILEKQKEFFEHGHMSLVPMTLKDVAQTIDRNESTISRAVTNKYMDTPRGLLPLKFFFSQGISENGNGAVASRGIKEEIKEMIETEDKSSPLSDQAIQNYFKRKDVSIARRTISKYRHTLRILPSHLRKS